MSGCHTSPAAGARAGRRACRTAARARGAAAPARCRRPEAPSQGIHPHRPRADPPGPPPPRAVASRAMPADTEKRAAAEAAAQLVEDGMRVGLGTRITVAFLLPALARARPHGLRCVATSTATEQRARELGLAVESFDRLDRLDIADRRRRSGRARRLARQGRRRRPHPREGRRRHRRPLRRHRPRREAGGRDPRPGPARAPGASGCRQPCGGWAGPNAYASAKAGRPAPTTA